MRNRAVLIVMTAWVILWAVGAFMLQGAPPPLKVNKSAPLRLEEPGTAKPVTNAMATPHSMCYDCHANYKTDPFAIIHARHGIVCVECHGESEEHKNDEGNITAPEVMYPRNTINVKCRECHTIRDKVVLEPIEKKKHGAKVQIQPKDVVCMDCHGEQHLMNVRTTTWDKKTGKLLTSGGMENL